MVTVDVTGEKSEGIRRKYDGVDVCMFKRRKVEEIPVETRSVDKWKKVFLVMPLPMLPTLSLVCCKGWM